MRIRFRLMIIATCVFLLLLLIIGGSLLIIPKGQPQASRQSGQSVLTLTDYKLYRSVYDAVDLRNYDLRKEEGIKSALAALSRQVIIFPSDRATVVLTFADFRLCWETAPCDSVFSEPGAYIRSGCINGNYKGCVDIDSSYPGSYSFSPDNSGMVIFTVLPHKQPLKILAGVPIICSSSNNCWKGYPRVDPENGSVTEG